MQRIRVFDRSGKFRAEFVGSSHRVWALGDVGMAEFTLATKESKVTRENLEFGNFVLIEDDYLPPWVGVIDPPRGWDDGLIKVTAYDPLHLLETRYPLREGNLDLTAGSMFRQIIEWARVQELPALAVGDIWSGKGARKYPVNTDTDLAGTVLDLRGQSGHEYTFTHYWTSPTSIGVKANWYEAIGKLQTRELNEKNCQLMSPSALEDGPVLNRIVASSSAQSSADRLTVTVEDADSIAAWGLRVGKINPPDADSIAALTNAAEAELGKYKRPKLVLNLRVTNHGGLFRYLRLGNVFPVDLHSIGFQQSRLGIKTNVRLNSIALFSEESTAILVADEVFDVEVLGR